MQAWCWIIYLDSHEITFYFVSFKWGLSTSQLPPAILVSSLPSPSWGPEAFSKFHQIPPGSLWSDQDIRNKAKTVSCRLQVTWKIRGNQVPSTPGPPGRPQWRRQVLIWALKEGSGRVGLRGYSFLWGVFQVYPSNSDKKKRGVGWGATGRNKAIRPLFSFHSKDAFSGNS